VGRAEGAPTRRSRARNERGLTARRLTPEQVQAILVAGTFDELLTAIEDEYLECKRLPYQLAEEHQKHELGKDVSGLANMSARLGIDGGQILVGARTEKSPQHHADVVVGVSHSKSVSSIHANTLSRPDGDPSL